MSGQVTVETPPCPMCNKSSTVEVDADGLRMWQGGAHIQVAFSQLSASERELLLTGTHPACWDRMWVDEEE